MLNSTEFISKYVYSKVQIGFAFQTWENLSGNCKKFIYIEYWKYDECFKEKNELY